MKKTKLNSVAMFISAIFLIAGCKKKDEPTPSNSVSINTSNGVFVINEGTSEGTITFFYPTDHSTIEDVFNKVNNRTLGTFVQSMNIFNGKGFIAVNGSAKVEVVDKNSFISLKTISGFRGPRFILQVNNNKAYVSDWFANNIKVIDLNSLTITDSIPAGDGPEQMVKTNNKVYVANIGGYDTDSTVTVIDAIADSVITTIYTGLNPFSAEVDANGKVWVLCSGWYGADYTGGTADDVAGKLVRINPETNTIETEFIMGQFDHPIRLAINKNKNTLYYLMGISGFDGSLYKFDINATSLPTVPMVNKNFYGLGIDPTNEDIYAGYSPSFGQSGYMFRYQSNGTLKDSTKVGIGPNGFVFNY